MKPIILFLLFAVFRSFAIDDTNIFALGQWSEPVETDFGHAIRGRLLVCDTPDHASAGQRSVDRAVYLELQEYSATSRPVRVNCGLHGSGLPDELNGLRCELRDSAGNLLPKLPFGTGGAGPSNSWVTLDPYCSIRLRASLYSGDSILEDGGLLIILAPSTVWEVYPNPNTDYYLSGTFTCEALPKVIVPRNVAHLWGFVNPTNMEIWYGTLTLPPVKIPMKKP
jgi:hypothetical protein